MRVWKYVLTACALAAIAGQGNAQELAGGPDVPTYERLSPQSADAPVSASRGFRPVVTGANGRVIKVRNFVGELIIDTAPHASISVDVLDGPAAYAGDTRMPRVEDGKRGVAIVGHKRAEVVNCHPRDGWVRLSGGSNRPMSDYPVIRVRAPADAKLDITLIAGIVRAENLASADVDVKGCGLIFMNNVDKNLAAEIDGRGEVHAGRIGRELVAAVKGGGLIDVERANGVVVAAMRGAGRISVNSGQISKAKVVNTGSGNVYIGGRMNALKAKLSGTGNVRIARVNGDLSSSTSGRGRLYVAGRHVR